MSGSVLLDVELNFSKLDSDLSKVRSKIETSLKDVKLNIALDSANIDVLTGSVNELVKRFDTFRDNASKPIPDSGTGAFRDNLNSVVQAVTKFAQVTGLSAGEARQFAESLGITDQTAARTAVSIQKLNAVGATADEKFAAIAAKLNLTRDQFNAIDSAIDSYTASQRAASDEAKRFQEEQKLLAQSLREQAAAAKVAAAEQERLAKQPATDAKGLVSAGGALGGFDKAKGLSQSLDIDPERLARAASLLKELQQGGADAGTRFAALKAEVGLTADQFNKLDGAVQKSKSGLGGFGEIAKGALRQVGANLVDSAANLAAEAGRAIAGGLSAAVASSIEFDAAIGKLRTLTTEADKFAQVGRDVASSLGNQITSTQALNAAYDVASSGFSKAADAQKILEASGRGAVAGFSDIGTIADATTTVLNSYGLGADKAAQVVDLLAFAQDKGKITAGELAGQLGRVSSIAAATGVSFNEVVSALSVATAKGAQTESAVSGIRQALINLLKPQADAQKLLEKYGITNAQATLQSEGLVGVLKRIQAAGGEANLNKIFTDTDAFNTISQIAGANLGTLTETLEQSNNVAGKAQGQFNAVAETIQGRLTAATNQGKEALITLGDAFKPAVASFLELGSSAASGAAEGTQALTILGDASQRLSEALQSNPQAVEALSNVFADLADILAGALATGIDGVAAFFNSDAFAPLASAVSGIIEVFGEFGSLLGEIGELIAPQVEQQFQGIGLALSILAKVVSTVLQGWKNLIQLFQIIAEDVGEWPVIKQMRELADLAIKTTERFAKLVGIKLPAPEPQGKAIFENTKAGKEAAKRQGEAALKGSGQNVDEVLKKEGLAKLDPNATSGKDAEKKQKEAEKKALDDLVNANKVAQDKIQNASQTRILTVQKLELDGVLTAKQAASQIANEKLIAGQQELKQIDAALKAVQSAEASKKISAEDAAKQRQALEQQRAQQILENGKAEIDLQRQLREVVLERLDATLKKEQADAQFRQGLNAIALQSVQQEQALNQASQGVQQAQLNLEREKLNTKLAQAQATGNETAQKEIQNQLSQLDIESQRQALEAKQKSLDLQIRQNELQQQQAELQAQIATKEAEIALQKAQASNASQAEIDNLQKVLSLRQQQEAATAKAGENQDKINDKLREQLELEKQAAAEKEKQTKIKQGDKPGGGSPSASGGAGLSGGSSGGGSSSGSGGATFFGEDANKVTQATNDVQRILDSTKDQSERVRQLLGLFNAAGTNKGFDGTGISQKDAIAVALQEAGLGQIASAGTALDSLGIAERSKLTSGLVGASEGNVMALLQQMTEQVTKLSTAPRVLNVTSNNPIADSARIQSETTRMGLAGAGRL